MGKNKRKYISATNWRKLTPCCSIWGIFFAFHFPVHPWVSQHFTSASVSKPSTSADWKHADNYCSQWQLILLPLYGLGLCRLRLVLDNQTFPFCVWYLLQSVTARLKHPDSFHATISINELSSEINPGLGESSHLSILSALKQWCFWSMLAYNTLTNTPDLRLAESTIYCSCTYTVLTNLAWQNTHTQN